MSWALKKVTTPSKASLDEEDDADLRNELKIFWTTVAKPDLERLIQNVVRPELETLVRSVYSKSLASSSGDLVSSSNINLDTTETCVFERSNDVQEEDWPLAPSERMPLLAPSAEIEGAQVAKVADTSSTSACRELPRQPPWHQGKDLPFAPRGEPSTELLRDPPKSGSHPSDHDDEMCILFLDRANRKTITSRPVLPETSPCSVKGFVESEVFEFLVAFLICINAIFVPIQIDLNAVNGTSDHLPRFDILNRTMRFLFYLEIGLRAYAYHPTFYKYARRNKLDIVVITFLFLSDIYNNIVTIFGWVRHPTHAEAISVIRMVRNFRLLRIIRNPSFLRLSRRFRLFVASFEDSIHHLACALFYVFMINYVVAVLLAAIVVYYKAHNPDVLGDRSEDLLIKFFGSVPVAILSLWEITLDGYVCGTHWAQLLPHFYQRSPLWVSILLVIYISVTKFGVLTIITGIFATQAMKHVQKDNMLVVQSYVDTFIRDSDADGDGLISWEEFRKNLQHPLVLEFFQEIGQDEEKAKRLFDRINTESSGKCSRAELVRTLATRAKL